MLLGTIHYLSDGLETLRYRAREIIAILVTSGCSPGISNYTVTMAPYERDLLSLLLQHTKCVLSSKAKYVSCLFYLARTLFHNIIPLKISRVKVWPRKFTSAKFQAHNGCDALLELVSFPDSTLKEGKASGTLRAIPWVC